VNEAGASRAVRRAGPADAAVVGRLLFDFNTEFEAATPDSDALSARFRELLGRDDVIVMLSGDTEAPTGFAFLTLRPTPYYVGPLAQLEELYVVPPLRNGGIGTALLSASVEAVSRAGSQEMHIGVDEVDVDTRRFYERHGFVNIEAGADYRMLLYTREF